MTGDIRDLMKRMGEGKEKKKKDSNTEQHISEGNDVTLSDLESTADAGPSNQHNSASSDTTPAELGQHTSNVIPSIDELIRTKADWQKSVKDGANVSI